MFTSTQSTYITRHHFRLENHMGSKFITCSKDYQPYIRECGKPQTLQMGGG